MATQDLHMSNPMPFLEARPDTQDNPLRASKATLLTSSRIRTIKIDVNQIVLILKAGQQAHDHLQPRLHSLGRLGHRMIQFRANSDQSFQVCPLWLSWMDHNHPTTICRTMQKILLIAQYIISLILLSGNLGIHSRTSTTNQNIHTA